MPWLPQDLEEVLCDFCRSADHRLVVRRPDGLAAVECRGCGLCFLNPRPKGPLIARLYGADYFTKSNPGPGPSKVGYADYLEDEYRRQMLKTNRNRLKVVRGLLRLRGSRCLEVGCATGELCHLLSQSGAVPMGIDLSGHAVEHAQKRYPGLAFQTGDLASLSPDRRFDAIFGFELIEHVTSPARFFAEASGRLNPGGFLVFTTPNYDCGKRVGVDRWLGFLSSFEHLYFFSSESLSRYGRAAGLEMVAWFTNQGSGLVGPPPPPKSALRRLMNLTLRRAGLLNLAVAARDRLRGTIEDYAAGGAGHNLYMVFKRSC